MGLSKVDGGENNLHYLALKRREFSPPIKNQAVVLLKKSWVLCLGFERFLIFGDTQSQISQQNCAVLVHTIK
jgi:hypothetical protein